MTQMSFAPQSMPVVAATQAAAAPGSAADGAAEADAGIDFAAVLQAQIAQPAKDVPAAEIFAALMPSRTTEAGEEASPADGLPVTPDLASWLATLPAPAGTTMPVVPESARPAADSALAGAMGGANPAALAQTSASEPAGVEEAAQTSLPPLRRAAGPSFQAQAEAVATPPAADPPMPVTATEHANPNASMHAAAPLAQSAKAGEAAPIVHVATPVGSRGWDADVGQKIVLLANRLEGRAELTLTPPQLGRLEITISVNGDQTSAAFVSASPAAREALEQALPRLREMLAEAGITLGQASVNAESAQRDNDGSLAEGRGRGRSADAARSADSPAQWVRQGNGLIDTFA